MLYREGQNNLCEEWKKIMPILDGSNLDSADFRFSLDKEGGPGLLKSEVKSLIITSFSCKIQKNTL